MLPQTCQALEAPRLPSRWHCPEWPGAAPTASHFGPCLHRCLGVSCGAWLVSGRWRGRNSTLRARRGAALRRAAWARWAGPAAARRASCTRMPPGKLATVPIVPASRAHHSWQPGSSGGSQRRSVQPRGVRPRSPRRAQRLVQESMRRRAQGEVALLPGEGARGAAACRCRCLPADASQPLPQPWQRVCAPMLHSTQPDCTSVPNWYRPAPYWQAAPLPPRQAAGHLNASAHLAAHFCCPAGLPRTNRSMAGEVFEYPEGYQTNPYCIEVISGSGHPLARRVNPERRCCRHAASRKLGQLAAGCVTSLSFRPPSMQYARSSRAMCQVGPACLRIAARRGDAAAGLSCPRTLHIPALFRCSPGRAARPPLTRWVSSPAEQAACA